LVEGFGLKAYFDQRTLDLPLGIRQRVSLAVAIVHEPEILILDEPTSGVDPLARDRFWEILIDLSRNQGVTIFISTHFMNEAERCDRISLMDSGHVLATDTPAGLVKARGAATLEDAFIGYLEEATRLRSAATAPAPLVRSDDAASPTPSRSLFSFRRLLAYTIREALELLRDPIRLGFSLFGTTLLMLVFGFGVSTDVNNLSFAVLDQDQSPESRAYLEELRGSAYFVEKPVIADEADLISRLKSGGIKAAIEIPPNFGLDIKRGRPAWVSALVDGAMPFRAETIRGYLQGMHQLYLADPTIYTTALAAPPPSQIEVRFKYNQDFDSIYAMVPSNIALLLGLFPAILMALAIVREKELGSITNLYVTPVTRIEFLLGKQLPYIAVAMANFTLMLLMALFVFHVPLKGSFPSPSARRPDLRHRDDGIRHADLRFHQHADRGAVWNGHFDGSAGNPIRGHDDAGVLARHRSTNHGSGIPDDLLCADQRRRFHQRARNRRSLDGPRGFGGVRAGAGAAERSHVAETGALDRCARLKTYSGSE
jgi:ribosome-dependent ATPase